MSIDGASMRRGFRQSERLLLAVAVLLLLVTCRVSSGKSGTSVSCGNSPGTSLPGLATIPLSGPEVWKVAGKNYAIKATYLIVMADEVGFGIDYLCEQDCDRVLKDATEKSAELWVTPIMRYALGQGRVEQAKLHSTSLQHLPTSFLVSIIRQSGIRQSGYRVAKRIDQLRAEVNAGETR